MSNEVHVKGLKELNALLQSLPLKIEQNIMRSALLQGAKVVRDAAKQNVPIAVANDRNRERYGGYAGALRDSIRAGSRIARGGKPTAYIRAGGKKGGADTYYAKWVEYGTKGHAIGKPGQVLKINGRLVAAPVQHPGARPKPFLRPAMDANATAAVVAVGNWVKHRLDTRGGYEYATAQINVEAEE